MLDARSPFVIDVHELGRRAGSSTRVHRTEPAPEGFGIPVIAVAQGTPVELDVLLESVIEGVLVSGSARTVATGTCSRCLEDVQQDVEVDLQELFRYQDIAEHHEPDDEELPVLQGNLLDLEPVIRDAIVLSLPLAPVCSPDCQGLCPRCGQRMADDPDHAHDEIDPRWAALADLQNKDEGRAPGATGQKES